MAHFYKKKVGRAAKLSVSSKNVLWNWSQLPANSNKQRKTEEPRPKKFSGQEQFEAAQDLEGISVSHPGSGLTQQEPHFKHDKDKLQGVFMEQLAWQEQSPLSLPEQVKLEAGIIFNQPPTRTTPSVPPRAVPETSSSENESSSEQQPAKRKAEGWFQK